MEEVTERQRLFELFESIYLRDSDVQEAFIDVMEEEFKEELMKEGTFQWYENE